MAEVLKLFLKETEYINFLNVIIQKKAKELFAECKIDIVKTAKASDVLKYSTGICHAKANLLAELLRSQGIPCGMCFQHLTLADDDSLGYCIHCYNAVFVNGKWIKLDARGNKKDVDAQFSLDEPKLAFIPRPQLYDEYFYDGIYANPNKETMEMLEQAKSIQDIINYIPCSITPKPDIIGI